MANYLIGIDLGTTNCTMAYAKTGEEIPVIEQFLIPQVTASETEGESLSLPSFLYFPLKEELKSKISGISWDPKRQHCVGLFARERGGEVPSRLIASAKSWLCHSGINRRDKLLPIIADDDAEKMSPLEACASILQHLREAWESKMPDASFGDQQVLITVPASFDPSARQLVQEASTLAGYPEIILLEEPQAAFYAWLHDNAETWRSKLSVDDIILVVDIGGGTTDFSLISVGDEKGNLVLQRQAVGAHLLLGGDNIDLSLAYLAKSKLEELGNNIDDWQLQALVHTCRQAKEKLMSAKPPKSVDITIMGRSSKLIGGTLKTQITKEEAHQLILDGFAPLTKALERSENEKRSGMQQIGLPYAQDARISCQLAKFLSMTGDDDSATDKFILPSAILFNGGTMKSDALRDRIVEILNAWAKDMKKDPIKILPNPDLDYAVSRGAVNYGLAREGKAIRIKSGTSCSYFIGVEDAVPAVPGMPAPLKAICVVPFGMEEGTESELSNQEFALVLGEPATFRFFSRNTRQMANGAEPLVGTIIKTWKKDLTELHPVETHLDKTDNDGKTVCVKLKSKVTELGVLELWCVANDGRKWKLEFDIR